MTTACHFSVRVSLIENILNFFIKDKSYYLSYSEQPYKPRQQSAPERPQQNAWQQVLQRYHRQTNWMQPAPTRTLAQQYPTTERTNLEAVIQQVPYC